jgi:hypothetical protein
LGERQVAEFVEHQQIDAHQSVGNVPRSALFDLGFELVDEIDDVEEAGFAARPDDAADDAVALAAAADQLDVALGVQKAAGAKLFDQPAVDRRSGKLQIGQLLGRSPSRGLRQASPGN